MPTLDYQPSPAAPEHVAFIGRYGQLAPLSSVAGHRADVAAPVEH